MRGDGFHVLLSGRFGAAERDAWRCALREAAPEFAWWFDDDADTPREAIAAAVVANPAPGALAGMPKLRLVQSLWAGVEGLLGDDTLPANVPLARMVDPALSAAMAETALWAMLSLQRRFFDYAERQAQAAWVPHPQRRCDEVDVLVLGAGHMGRAVGARLVAQGYRVGHWYARDTDKTPLVERLSGAEIVIDLLPLTPATRGLLDADFFAAMPRGASIVNLARGAHVVDKDLLAALDSGHLHRAVLDVFHEEPLPPEHRYWRHPRVTVLPHVAALTDPRSAARVVAANLHALREGAPLAHLVDRARGY